MRCYSYRGRSGAPPLGPQQPIYSTGGGSNYGSYTNTSVDQNLTDVVQSFDYSKQAQLANTADKTIWDDLGTIPLFQLNDILAYSNKISGVTYNPTQQGYTWNVPAWKVAS